MNGVPLRRIPQSYVIATSTRLDLLKLCEAADVSEQMFVREKKKRNTEGMFEQDQQVGILVPLFSLFLNSAKQKN